MAYDPATDPNNALLSSYGYIRTPGAPASMQQQQPSSGGLDSIMQYLIGGKGQGGGGGGNKRSGPGAPLGGGVDELFYDDPRGFNASASVDPSHGDHLHFGSDDVNMRRVARKLDNKGFTVSGLEGWQGQGQISSGHATNSYHYRDGRNGMGQGMDVNYYGGGKWNDEQKALSWLERWLARKFG